MTYAYDLENGQRLIVQNDGDDTLVALSNGDQGQQQSQSTGFNTAKAVWSSSRLVAIKSSGCKPSQI